MGAGTVMMLTPSGISIELHHTNILAWLEMNVCFTYSPSIKYTLSANIMTSDFGGGE